MSEHRYLTTDLPGIGGVIRQRPDDFLVEEQPLYEPCGEGEHLYLFVEKSEMTTHELVRRVAKKLRVSKRDIGFAGLKDKYAITRQHLSVYLPGRSQEDDARGVEAINRYQRIQVLWAARHTNKLRKGHHGGNRFVIRVRGVEPTAVIRAKPILDQVVSRGVPNYVGPQRFGFRNNSQDIGRLLMLGQYQAMLDEMLGRAGEQEHEPLARGRELYEAGDFAAALALWPKSLRYDRQALDALVQGREPRDVVRAIDREQRDFVACAFQSAVFNRVLTQRVEDDTFDRLLPGDVAMKHDNRACFAVDADTAAAENAEGGRSATLAVSPTGPMWASDMMRAAGEVDALERAALEAQGMTLEQVESPDELVRLPGSRRPLRISVRDADLSGGVDEHGPYVRLSFELGRGSFATTVLAEVMKNDVEG